jgi:hypothetical protein
MCFELLQASERYAVFSYSLRPLNNGKNVTDLFEKMSLSGEGIFRAYINLRKNTFANCCLCLASERERRVTSVSARIIDNRSTQTLSSLDLQNLQISEREEKELATNSKKNINGLYQGISVFKRGLSA